MAVKTLKTHIQTRCDTYANWIANNPVPLLGEICIVFVPAKTGVVAQEPETLYKVGDGVSDFKTLPFASAKAADVYDWAKAANKPEYTATDVGALPATGGTVTGNLIVGSDTTSNVIIAPMGSGAVIHVKQTDDSYINSTIDPNSSTVIVSSGVSQDPIIVRGIAEPQIDTDAVNKKFITDNYVPIVGSSFSFPGITMIQNVATPGTDYQAANKLYVDGRISFVTQSVSTISISANTYTTGDVSVELPSGVTSTGYKFYSTIIGNNLNAILSITKTTFVSSGRGAWLRVSYMGFNPTSDAVSGQATVQILCVRT